jgi:hypothetical protein
MKAMISPVVYATPAVTRPMTWYARKAPAGPAMEMTCPELRKRPVPWKGTVRDALRVERVAWYPGVAYDHPGNGDHVDVAGLEVAFNMLDSSMLDWGCVHLDICLCCRVCLGLLASVRARGRHGGRC